VNVTKVVLNIFENVLENLLIVPFLFLHGLCNGTTLVVILAATSTEY